MSRHFEHAAGIWADFPTLVPGVMLADGINSDADITERGAALVDVAAARLAVSSEGGFPEVQAWRRAFTQLGFKPTQYRCASESLLRRYRKEGSLPPLHPLVDLCNVTSIAFAIPVAAFDIDRIEGDLRVRYAHGDETYLSFTGQAEHPEPGEVVLRRQRRPCPRPPVDPPAKPRVRRWTHRQSRASAVSDTTTPALILTEALHDTAPTAIRPLQSALTDALTATWHITPASAVLSQDAPLFAFPS